MMKDTPWATEILAEAADLLDSTGEKWWLECGVLLGIHREGKLLDHDDSDIDFTVLEPADHDKLREVFQNNGYELFAEGNHQLVMKKRDVLVDISFYTLESEELVMRIHGAGRAVQSYSLFNPLGEVEFLGRIYPTTNDIEVYLEQRYGDWRTPKKEKRPWTEPGEHLVWKPEKLDKVITYGTFDCLHYGHIRLLERAKSLGRHLTVALSTDEFNVEKGKKAAFNFEQRRKDLLAISYVDDVISETHWEQKKDDIVQRGINLLVMGDDWAGKFDELPCKVIYLPRTPGVSSTKVRNAL